MTKKVFLLTIISFLVGGAVVFASTNYYADMVSNQKDQIKTELVEYYEEQFKERGQQVHHDMVTTVAVNVDELKQRMKEYIDQKIANDANGRMNQHSAEIMNAIDQLEVELKATIDELE